MKIHCDRCESSTDYERTPDVPKEAFGSRSNYCPSCETSMDDYWEEYYVYKNGDKMNFECINGEIVNVSRKL